VFQAYCHPLSSHQQFDLQQRARRPDNEQLICLANELNMPTHSPDVDREAIQLQYSFNQILIMLQYEEFQKFVQGRRDYEANLLHTTQEESFSFLRTIPCKKPLTSALTLRFQFKVTFNHNLIIRLKSLFQFLLHTG
jgi:hypothetical protein